MTKLSPFKFHPPIRFRPARLEVLLLAGTAGGMISPPHRFHPPSGLNIALILSDGTGIRTSTAGEAGSAPRIWTPYRPKGVAPHPVQPKQKASPEP